MAAGSTATWYHNDAFVPSACGLTVSWPPTTWSLMPSLGYGVPVSTPYSRRVLVSFSQNNATGSVPSGPAAAKSSSSPRYGWSITMVPFAPACRPGFSAPMSHDHVLRNHTVGRTCNVSVSGPALVTRTVISRSVGSALT